MGRVNNGPAFLIPCPSPFLSLLYVLALLMRALNKDDQKLTQRLKLTLKGVAGIIGVKDHSLILFSLNIEHYQMYSPLI